MEPEKKRISADESISRYGDSTDDEVPPVSVPHVGELPQPPVVNYTRPVLKKGQYAQAPDETRGVFDQKDDGIYAAKLGADLSGSITFASSVIVSVLIGMWIDKRFEPHSIPWATVVMTPLGFVAGFLTFIRISAANGRSGKRPK